MIGRLIWNQDRPDIALDTGVLYGGLHCGDCFQCWMEDRWIGVRLEHLHHPLFRIRKRRKVHIIFA